MARGKTPLAVELGLEKVVPAKYRRHAHHWLILHGRYICKARTPDCWRCVVAEFCDFKPKTLAPDERPAKTKPGAKKKAARKKPADRKSTRLNTRHECASPMPSSAWNKQT